MKILFTSELHVSIQTFRLEMLELRGMLERVNPDVLAISGDVSDMPDDRNICADLALLDVPVVFCLGNHEFAYHSVTGTIEKWKNDMESVRMNGIGNVCCLDVDGHFDMDGIRFYGNVLWYDGSLSNRLDTAKYMRHVWKNWLDSTIIDFNPMEEHLKCIRQLKESQNGWHGNGLVLLTHCVPHRRLNAFDVLTPMSIANCYSGVDDLFGKHGILPDFALCGHTHKRCHYEHHVNEVKMIDCINSGNDYFFNTGHIDYDVIEV